MLNYLLQKGLNHPRRQYNCPIFLRWPILSKCCIVLLYELSLRGDNVYCSCQWEIDQSLCPFSTDPHSILSPTFSQSQKWTRQFLSIVLDGLLLHKGKLFELYDVLEVLGALFSQSTSKLLALRKSPLNIGLIQFHWRNIVHKWLVTYVLVPP